MLHDLSFNHSETRLLRDKVRIKIAEISLASLVIGGVVSCVAQQRGQQHLKRSKCICSASMYAVHTSIESSVN